MLNTTCCVAASGSVCCNFLQFCVALSFFECVDCQLVWTALGFTVMPFCIFFAYYYSTTGPTFRVLLCVYTPETYRNNRVIRPCFLCRLLLHCCVQKSSSPRYSKYLDMYVLSRGGASARLLAIRFARKDASSVTSAPEPIVDISISDISRQVAETFD